MRLDGDHSPEDFEKARRMEDVSADRWHAEIGDYCEPTHPAEPCPNCGARNNGELHIPEFTLLCWVCETRFPVTNPLAETP